jgi:nitrogen fixation protein FixH
MSLTDAPRPKGFRITGWHVFFGVTLFFAVVIAVDLLFIVKAYESFSGQIVKNPYEAGLAFNQRLRDQQHQAALGWQVDAGLRPDGDLVVTVLDKAGAPVEGLRARATLERPATERGRLELVLRESAPGVYRARQALAAGAWDLSALLDGPDGPFRAERRIIAP